MEEFKPAAEGYDRFEAISVPPEDLSWLRRHYRSSFGEGRIASERGQLNLNSTYAINNHLYDNISFADSPLLRSLSQKGHDEHPQSSLDDDDNDEPGPGCCFGKFRIFLACYVLFGITLNIYSRNALSLAAVGMIASNQINRELVVILSTTGGPRDANTTSNIYSALDGSCPLYKAQVSSSAGTIGNNNYLFDPQAQSFMLSEQEELRRSQLEASLRLSAKQRIERGELVDWSPSEQGLIFAAGSVGNLLIAIPLTRLGEIYGPKWIVFVAALGATIQATFMPLVSPWPVALVIVFQVIFNGLTFGADCVAYTLFAHWLTPTEMALFVSCLLICYQMGTIMSSFITSKILAEGLAWSWCFYTPAMLCGLWTLVWVLIGASEPSKSGIISRRELIFLLKNNKIAHRLRESREKQMDQQQQQQDRLREAPILWLKLAKDANIWAIIAVKFTLRWYFSVYLSLMPTYLSSVAHMSVETIGKMSVFQSFVGLGSGILMGYMTKSLVSHRPFNMALATTRKIFQSIVNFGLALSLVVFIIYDCNQWITIVTLTLGGICINFYVAAALQLPLDLSLNHCGLITSITNTLAIGQALGAPVSGLILNSGPKDRTRWRYVWAISTVMNTLSGLIFILLVDSKPRDYSKTEACRQVTITTTSWSPVQVQQDDDDNGDEASSLLHEKKGRRFT